MMYQRRKPNSSNSQNVFPPKTEPNVDGTSNCAGDSFKSSTAAAKTPPSLSFSSLPVLNSDSFYDLNVRTKISRKYFIILMVICTLTSVVPLILHVSIFKSSAEEEKIMEELTFPVPGNEKRLVQNNNRLSTIDVEENKFPNTTSLNDVKSSATDVASSSIEERFIELANKWKRKTPEIAKSLTIGYKPSENRPFIFFHQRKAGGSTFRQFLYDAANNLGARSWIPSCRFGPIPCAVFALPTHAKFAVYGGHFRYMEAHKNFIVTDFKTYLENKKRPHTKPFTCLLTARPTIDRVVSCWNYRFIHELKLEPRVPHSSNMTASQWDELLPIAFSKYNEGCNNEFIRNFGDIQDEIVINSMKPTGQEKYDLLALRELNNVFERISDCVVTTLPKCDEGLEVIGYFLPWLQRNAKYDCETKVNAIQDKFIKKSNQLGPSAEKAILKHNFVDELIYDFIDTLFEEQLKFARENRKTDFKQVPIKRTNLLKEEAKKIVKKILSSDSTAESGRRPKNDTPSTEQAEKGDQARTSTLEDVENTKDVKNKEETIISTPNDIQPPSEKADFINTEQEEDTTQENEAKDEDENTAKVKPSDSGDNNLPVDEAMKREMDRLESNIINANPDDKDKELIVVSDDKDKELIVLSDDVEKETIASDTTIINANPDDKDKELIVVSDDNKELIVVSDDKDKELIVVSDDKEKELIVLSDDKEKETIASDTTIINANPDDKEQETIASDINIISATVASDSNIISSNPNVKKKKKKRESSKVKSQVEPNVNILNRNQKIDHNHNR